MYLIFILYDFCLVSENTASIRIPGSGSRFIVTYTKPDPGEKADSVGSGSATWYYSRLNSDLFIRKIRILDAIFLDSHDEGNRTVLFGTVPYLPYVTY